MLLYNTNNSIYQSSACTLLNGFKYRKWLNIFTWPTDGILTGTTTLDQSWPGSNSNEGVFHIPQNSRTGALSSDGLVSYPEHLRGWGGGFFLLLCRDAVSIFYSHSQLGCRYLGRVKPIVNEIRASKISDTNKSLK